MKVCNDLIKSSAVLQTVFNERPFEFIAKVNCVLKFFVGVIFVVVV